MPLSLREKTGLCFFGVDEKKMKVVDLIKEDCQDMMKIRVGRENSVSSSSSPRLLLSRWLSSLTPRCRSALYTSSSSKKKRDADDKVELIRSGEGSKAVVGSLARVAPENDGSSEFGCAVVEHGQRMFGKGKCMETSVSDYEKKGELGNQMLSGSIDGVKDVVALPLKEASKGDETILKDLKVNDSSSMEDVPTCSTSENRVVLSGRYIEKSSFNLGIGVGLALLINSSKNEFAKMIELQARMEILLKDIRNEMQRKDMISSDSKINNNNLRYFASNSNGAESTENHVANKNHGSSDHLVVALSTVKYGQCSKSDSKTGNAKSVGIHQLEAELEAELEHLQFKLDAEDTTELQGQQCMEMVVDNALIRSFSPSFGEEHDLQESHSNDCYGVSPNELEKRLHELLETRQQEQIVELESALECAERKLQEKEMEISWWKDNVQFLLQQKR